MKEVVKNILNSICRISTDDGGSGTGFLITCNEIYGRKFILTNSHVVDSVSSAEIKFHGLSHDNTSILCDNLKVLVSDYSRDLAIIELDNKLDSKYKPLSPRDKYTLDIGDTFFSGGYPLSCEYPRVVSGILSGINFNEICTVTNFVHVLDATIHPGQSGSPVCDSNGNLQSIVYAGIRADQSNVGIGIAYSVPLIGISEMLVLAYKLACKLDFKKTTWVDIEVDRDNLARFQDWCVVNVDNPAPALSCNSDFEVFIPSNSTRPRIYAPKEFNELLHPILSVYLKQRNSGGRFYLTGKSIFVFTPATQSFTPLANIKTEC